MQCHGIIHGLLGVQTHEVVCYLVGCLLAYQLGKKSHIFLYEQWLLGYLDVHW